MQAHVALHPPALSAQEQCEQQQIYKSCSIYLNCVFYTTAYLTSCQANPLLALDPHLAAAADALPRLALGGLRVRCVRRGFGGERRFGKFPKWAGVVGRARWRAATDHVMWRGTWPARVPSGTNAKVARGDNHTPTVVYKPHILLLFLVFAHRQPKRFGLAEVPLFFVQNHFRPSNPGE
jgi:hypothetical protein